MNTLFKALIFTCFAGHAFAESIVASDHRTYTDRIEVKTATLSGNTYATATGRVVMEGTLGAPLHLLSDIGGLTSWVANLIQVQEVNRRSLIDRQLYMRFGAPAGLKDRDGVMRFVAHNEGPNIVILSLDGLQGGAVQSDAVQMKDVQGRFRFEQLPNRMLAVEFRLYYDPGVTPIFLANRNTQQQVAQTLSRMQTLVEGPLASAQVDGPVADQLGL